MAGGVGGLKDRLTGILRHQRERRPWLDHLVRAYQRYKQTNGDHLAAAVTYFSFLAIFPLVLLAVSVAAFVLSRQPDQIEEIKQVIVDNVPGSLGAQLAESVDSIISNRGAIGVVGLVGVAYAGLGWIGNLRTAVQLVWSSEQVEESFVKAKLGDLLVLVGLGAGILVSIGLTAGGTAAADSLVRLAGLEGVIGMGTLVTVVGILLGLAADTLIFAWLFVRLPRRPVRYRTALRGALFAAVGYEALKIVATFYLKQVASSPTYGPFAGAVGLLIWIDLVSRFLLIAAAWTATGQQPPAPDERADEPEPGPAASVAGRPADGLGPGGRTSAPGLPSVGAGTDAGRDADGRRGVPGGRDGSPGPAAVAGVLVGAGAALGATAATAGRRYLRRRGTPPE
jgi:membrane protein